ncbi:hypothetical protein D9603_04735 [Pseudoalteromonas sp. PS5]|nr:hypothetical protein D9603_04735 [Pseudoalteromonas sp. PS5]
MLTKHTSYKVNALMLSKDKIKRHYYIATQNGLVPFNKIITRLKISISHHFWSKVYSSQNPKKQNKSNKFNNLNSNVCEGK